MINTSDQEKKIASQIDRLGSAYLYPPTPDCFPGVIQRIQTLKKTQSSRPWGLRRWDWGARQRLAWSVVFMFILAAVVFIGIVGPRNAFAQVQRWLGGYIPGIGMVEEVEGLRVLAEPVSQERDGVTVEVKKAVSDAQRTTILLEVTHIPASARPRSERGPLCMKNPELQLPDGTTFQMTDGGGRGWGSGYEHRLVFPGAPRGIGKATLFIPCLMDTAPGGAPEEWSLALQFVPAPPDMTVVPVQEVTPEATAAEEAPVEDTPGSEGITEKSQSGSMGLQLDRVIELEDHFILVGSFQQGSGLPDARVIGPARPVEILDGDGKAIPYESASGELDLVSRERGVFPWAYRVPKGFRGSLTIQLTDALVEYPIDADFSFNVGENPTVGQVWRPDYEFNLSGHRVHLVSMVRVERGYELYFKSDESVSAVGLRDENSSGNSAGGDRGEIKAGLTYDDPVPTGNLNFHIDRIVVRYQGPWTVSWQPPEDSQPSATLTVEGACLPEKRLKDILEGPVSESELLSGKLVLYGPLHGTEFPSSSNYGLSLVDVEQDDLLVLGEGTWPALSPEGSKIAYSGENGLHVIDLDTDEDVLLSGTTENDYQPRWSPGGNQLAFVRSEDRNIYVINADGSGLRQVTDNREHKQVIGWMPDGEGLVIASPGPEGQQFYIFNIVSGVQQDAFAIDHNSVFASISNDGQRMAYLKSVTGGMDVGLFVSDMEGSNKKLIMKSDTDMTFGIPLWSPEGGRLLVSVRVSPSERQPVLLVEPVSCGVWKVGEFMGRVYDWTR